MSVNILTRSTPRSQDPADSRLARAHELLRAGAVQPVKVNTVTFAALVRSQSRPNVCYPVTLGPESCGCEDHRRGHNGGLCKHILAARFYFLRQWEAQQ